jgi:lysophospholipase L1-like esterase
MTGLGTGVGLIARRFGFVLPAPWGSIPQIAVFGCSLAAQTSQDYTNHPAYNATGSCAWANLLSDGQFTFPHELNFGVVGDTTDQIVARLPALIAAKPSAVVLPCPATNDRNSNELRTAQHSIDNLIKILDACYSAGIPVILTTEFPRGNATFASGLITGTQLNYHRLLRRWVLDVAANRRGVTVIDTWPLLADLSRSDGAMLLVNTYDGTHLAPIGAAKVGAAIAAVLRAMFPRKWIHADYDAGGLYHATENPRGNLIPNPGMIGTAGTKDAASTGSLGDSNTSTRDAAFNSGTLTTAFSKVARAGFNDWQQVVLGGTAGATANQNLEIYQSASNANFAEGDKVRAVCDVELGTTMTGICGVTLRTTKTVGGVAESSSALRPIDTSPMPASGIYGGRTLLMVTRPFTVPAGAVTQMRARMVINTIPGAVVDGTVRWGNMRLEKVAA